MSGKWVDITPKKSDTGEWVDIDSPSTAETPSVWESAIRGAGQSASFGFGDEIEAGVRSLVGPESYDEELATAREANKLAESTNPKSYFAGEIGGALAPGAGMAKLGIGAVAKGAPLLNRALQGAKIGAAQGGLYGVGSTEDKSDLDELATRVGVGTTLGGTLGGLFPVAGAGFSRSREIVGDGVNYVTDKVLPENIVNMARSAVPKMQPRPDANEVIAAAKTLAPEAELPGYMLAKDMPTKQMASTLLDSPTIGGALERKAVAPFSKAVEEYAQEVASKTTSPSAYSTGEAVRKGIASKFDKAIEPAEQIYNAIEDKFTDVPLRKLSIKQGLTELQKDVARLDPTGNTNKLINGLRDKLLNNVHTVSDLRQFRTNLRTYYPQNQMSDAEKTIINKMYGVLTRERDRSILRDAIKGGSKIGRKERAGQLLNHLKQADSIYKDALTSFSETLPIKGSRGKAGSTAIRQYLQETPAEDIVKQLFDSGDVASLQKLSKQFPEEFKQLTNHYLGQIVDKSTNKGSLNPNAVIKSLGNKPTEVQQMILGDLANKQSAAQKLTGAIPDISNPSRTSIRQDFSNFLSPSWYAKNALSIPQRSFLKRRGAEGLEKAYMAQGAQEQLQSISQKIQGHPKANQYLGALGEALQRGDKSYAATYYLMSQTDPEFRRLMDQEDGT